MSHVVAGSVVVNDLELLKKVIEKHFPKLKWMEGQKTYSWFGSWQADYSKDDAAYKNGIDVEDYGKCSSAIRMDGVTYEIGVCKRKDGQGYSLVWDFWADGKTISDYIGKGAEKLMTEYSREYVNQYANNYGFIAQETEDEQYYYINLTQ